jgi:tetratricopeptide (TPR) repeat protein
MRLTRAIAVLAAGLILAVAELPAQLRPNRLPPQRVNTNPRLLVATPHVFSATDSASAVQVGNGMRNRLSGQAERWYNVITREQMNEALEQYAYPLDAVLPPLVVRSLANAMQARTMVSSSMVRGTDGRYTIQARLVGVNDDAGHLVTVTQAANQSPESFGVATANALLPAFRAMPDAKACMDEMTDSRDRAASEARKALNQQANHGLASYCLGEIAFAQGDTTAAIRNFAAAAEGDPLSLKAWNQLAILYQLTGDSANTVTTFQQMLRVAPTNQALREEAFGLFLRYDRPGAARQVAEEGLELDPQNADLWDLKSNACLYAEDYVCAIDALETAFAVDSTKADTTFFQKITYASSRQPDTTRFLRWSQAGAKKYPDNPYMLEQLIQAYGYAGPVDSVVAVTRRLVAMDNSDMTPVIRAVQALGNAGRIEDALPLGEYIEQYGNSDDRSNFAGLLVNAAQPMLAEAERAPVVVAMMRRAVPWLAEGGQPWRAANLFLGAGAFNVLVAIDRGIEESRSCDSAREMQALLDEAGPALTSGRPVAEDYANQLLQGVEAYRSRVTSLIRAYCR